MSLSGWSIITGAGLVVLLLLGGPRRPIAEGAHSPSSAHVLRPTRAGCTSRLPASRWVTGSASYARTHVYGQGEEAWLATVSGVAAADGLVVVYDEGRPGIDVLTPTLEPVRRFGRSGPGPGEISGGIYTPWVPRYWDYSYLGFDGSTIVVYDRVELEVFHADGTFQYQVHAPDDSHPWAHGIRYVRPDGGGRLLYVADSVDFQGHRPRRLQTWSIDRRQVRDSRILLWEIPLPWDTDQAVARTLSREARPFWAGTGGCHVATDGSGSFLFRYDRTTGRLDSLPLPRWDVPAFGDHEDDSSVASQFDRSGKRKPVALIRWTDLVIDPDGWAWVRAWTPRRSPEVKAFAVSLQTGAIVELDVPAFPRAFGEPGVFYTVERDAETGEQLVVRFERKE